MADQRPAFRFRLPWLPPLPPPPPPPRPTIAPTPTPVQPPPPPPPREEVPAPTQTILTPPPPPSPPLQAPEAQVPTQNPTTQEPSQVEETKVPTPTMFTPPTQNTEETNITTNSSPIVTPRMAETQASTVTRGTTTPQTVGSQSTLQFQPPTTSSTTPATAGPPFIPPEQAPPHVPLPPQAPRSQPSSPSRAGDPLRVLSQPSSPARAGATAQPRVSSQPSSPTQPSSPSRANTRPPVSLQPTSSSRAKITSPLGSPSRATNQPQNSSKPSSPARTPSRASPQPSSTPQTALQPHSASLHTSDSTDQASSSRSPYSPPDQHKPISETINISSLPNQEKLKPSQERLQPSYTSQNNNPSASHKIQSNLHESEQQYSMNKTSRQSSAESDPPKRSDKPDHTEKIDTTRRLEHFLEGLKQDETKEVKEVMKVIRENTYGKAGHQDDFHHDTVPVPDTPQAKEHTNITFQSTPIHESVGRNGKEVNRTFASNGKETKNKHDPRNKTMVGGDPHPKQVASNTSIIPLQKEIRDDISKLVHKMAVEDPKLSTKDKPVSHVITLAGENRGASMHLGSDSSKHGRAIQIHRGYKIKHDESDETTTNEEGSSKNKTKDAKSIEDEEDKEREEAYVNSNIQGINNSIVFDSSISERNPGVHIIHSHFPETRRTTDQQHEKKLGESSTVHHAQKLTHNQPMVKRRCLRGLFLESSDSDSDDSSKPRRHGCRVGECSTKAKDNSL